MTSASRASTSVAVAIALGLVLSASDARADQKKSAWLDSAGRSASDHRNPRFRLDLAQPQTLQIDLESSADPYLYLLNQDGSTQLAADDDSGGNLNSRITLSLAAGKYLLVAGTYNPGKRADFTIRTTQGAVRTCFHAYTDASYGGSSTTFCEGGGAFQNDAYSSFRVPRGLRVRAYEHGGLGGIARTYYQDVPFVGALYNDKISSVQWSDFSVDDYVMVFASDPQLSWTNCEDSSSSPRCAAEQARYPGWSQEDLGRLYNERLVSAINSVKDHLGDSLYGGTVVNGDLTEFGNQGPDLDDYIRIYEHGLRSNVYLGLGNHDYANNVGDCSENGCATSMVWYLKEQVSTLNPARFDYVESGTYYSFPSNRRDHVGSLGYSWDIGNVHYVQLNNHPGYTRSWNGWNFSAARRDYIDIYSALGWLQSDLAAAASAGKKIVVNLHDWGAAGSTAAFTALLDQYPVSAVYAGHWHDTVGQVTRRATPDGKAIPVLLSGSANHGTFLVSRFLGDQMYVWVMAVDQLGSGALQVDRGSGFEPVASLNGLFDVCNDCTPHYTHVYDLR
ncbi:metallophosphoesterase [Chondromyces apiculatus]|uniref:Calcineurin-like phosphoesterase domain-containing protein n=1 Tax=Chondromyces apiculatus DSM 436 TaxID=1192034 RepID=A0A017TEM8_9BACT|nr:metallophosphoesterase [Chondromyces apiculatus]EYF07694.1 Hypothetical protein CAP_8195 [Chondromyces apiculatus DSM 436]